MAARRALIAAALATVSDGLAAQYRDDCGAADLVIQQQAQELAELQAWLPALWVRLQWAEALADTLRRVTAQRDELREDLRRYTAARVA